MDNCNKCQENYYCECEMREKNITILRQGIRLDFLQVLNEMEDCEHEDKILLTSKLMNEVDAKIEEFIKTLL